MVETPDTERRRQAAGSGAQGAQCVGNQPMGGREIGGSGGDGRPVAGIGYGASDNAGPAMNGNACTTSSGCWAQLRTQSLIWQWASWAGALACGA